MDADLLWSIKVETTLYEEYLLQSLVAEHRSDNLNVIIQQTYTIIQCQSVKEFDLVISVIHIKGMINRIAWTPSHYAVSMCIMTGNQFIRFGLPRNVCTLNSCSLDL